MTHVVMKEVPKMVKKAACPDLQKAFESHLEETKTHVERVEKAFEDTGKSPKAKTCEAMKGLITEAEDALKEEAEPSVMDAVIIACAQKAARWIR